MDYRYLNTRGWLNETAMVGGEPPAAAPPAPSPSLSAGARSRAAPAARTVERSAQSSVANRQPASALHEAENSWTAAEASGAEPEFGHTLAGVGPPHDWRASPVRLMKTSKSGDDTGIDSTATIGGDEGVFFNIVEEGQRSLLRRPNGTMDVVVGPRRVLKVAGKLTKMTHYIAHPGDYLIVRFRDGHQEHMPGPSEVWLDPRLHASVATEEGLQLAAKEAVVVYSGKEGTSEVQRRVVYGPALFIPRPGEWLHTFSWHASKGGSRGIVKIPNGLVFQKLWLMPDQMYHDVGDVRTADDAVLTIRLMLFFELVDINTMLDTTHDPIGDFVNAASSDVVDFVGRHDFESFKKHTGQLNELAAYKQLTGRAGQCGYRLNKVVYRGYGAPENLQEMHDQAIEARTRLQLARETERQTQELRDSKLENRVTRASKRRSEQAREVEHELTVKKTRLQSDLEERQLRVSFEREQDRLAAEQARQLASEDDLRERSQFAALRDLGVDLTAFLTRNRADRVIELRGAAGHTHVHVDKADGLPT
jgi:hypothetical protein